MNDINDHNKPKIISTSANTEFEQRCREFGRDPDNAWVGGYVDYQWEHLCPMLDAYQLQMAGRQVLEFGCNVGASAIVFASLGATVSAVDVEPEWADLARLNARRYGCSVEVVCVPDTRRLPFKDAQFDVVNCASVLEYVAPVHLPVVQREIDRVVKPGGRIVVTGTSSRLWPKEIHSRRWLVNYLPRQWDRWMGKSYDRGVWPWQIRYGFGAHYLNLDAGDQGRAFLAAREGLEGAGGVRRWVAKTAGAMGLGPGMFAHSMSCVLMKNFEQKETKETKGKGIIAAEGGGKEPLLTSFPSVQTSLSVGRN